MLFLPAECGVRVCVLPSLKLSYPTAAWQIPCCANKMVSSNHTRNIYIVCIKAWKGHAQRKQHNMNWDIDYGQQVPPNRACIHVCVCECGWGVASYSWFQCQSTSRIQTILQKWNHLKTVCPSLLLVHRNTSEVKKIIFTSPFYLSPLASSSLHRFLLFGREDPTLLSMFSLSSASVSSSSSSSSLSSSSWKWSNVLLHN